MWGQPRRRRYSECHRFWKQLRKLLTEIELGDQLPTGLLRRMKTLAGEIASEDILKTLWLQRMPTSVNLVMYASQDVDASKMGASADKVMEVSKNGSMATISNDDPANHAITITAKHTYNPSIAPILTA